LSKDSLVIQPSATISYKDFSFDIWANLDTDDYGDPGGENLNETDLTLSYDKSFGMVSLGDRYIYYGLDDADDAKNLIRSTNSFSNDSDYVFGGITCSISF
jgi:hypothetical protein